MLFYPTIAAASCVYSMSIRRGRYLLQLQSVHRIDGYIVSTDDGGCCVFDVQTGALEKTIRDFASQCTSSSSSDKSLVELSGLVHHPQKPIVAAFSNNKSQKRGLITLWK